MLIDNKKQALYRALIGTAVGVALHVLLGYLLGCFNLFGPAYFSGFRFPDCGFPYKLEPLGVVLSFVLWALLGAEVGVATLPFADSGRALVVRSLAHYVVTSATVGLWVALNFPNEPFFALPYFLIPLTLVYVLVWLGRWVGWFAEVAAIREKLGLAPGPSLFHWKETLPYVGFAFLLCLVMPLVLGIFETIDAPVLGMLYAFLLLSVGGFMAGLSLGRRHGFCPLYPAACVVFIGAFILTGPMIDGRILFAIALTASLTGNLAGTARHKMKKGTQTDEKANPSL